MNWSNSYTRGLTREACRVGNMLKNKCLRSLKRLVNFPLGLRERTRKPLPMPSEMCSSLSLSSPISLESTLSNPLTKFTMSSANAQAKQSTASSSRTATKNDPEIVVLKSKIAYVSGLLEGLTMRESLSGEVKQKLADCIERIRD